MEAGWIVGISVAAALLLPVISRSVSRRLNRRLAAKLARGPVGVLIRFDYDYAMALSRDVFAGEMSVEQAARIAERCLKRIPGCRPASASGEIFVHVDKQIRNG